MDGRFEGFADDQGKFFRKLAKNQNREWFQAHKEEFEAGWNAPMKLLVAELREAIDGQYPRIDLGEPRVFRIFRDVRFSKDKSPYKTHIGGYVPPKRAVTGPSGPVAIYVHAGPETFAAAGHYVMEGDDLARYRTAVAEDARGKELVKIIGKLEKKGMKVDAHGAFKRVPKGFDPEHPRAELLKYQGLTATFPPILKGVMTSHKLADWLVKQSKDVSPLVEWLVFATA
jgi:uncharacterized protein (TIGR02453 family)